MGRNLNGKTFSHTQVLPAAKTQKEAEELASMWASHITSDGKVKSTQLTDLLLEYVSIKRRNGASLTLQGSMKALLETTSMDGLVKRM